MQSLFTRAQYIVFSCLSSVTIKLKEYNFLCHYYKLYFYLLND